MASVYQRYLISWNEIQELGDLERLRLVIEHIPDQPLMSKLGNLRGNGRNSNPITAIWNSILAGIVFQHQSIESLRRELNRNAQLRQMCGFNPLKGHLAVPSKSAYSRFIAGLIKHKKLIDQMFDTLVDKLREILPGFGEDLAFDSKAIPSFGKKQGKCEGDQRGEHDAD
jgi:hypothetical protein